MGGAGGGRGTALASATTPGIFDRPVLALGGLMLAASLSLARQSGLGPFDTVYAEDGAVFLADAYAMSTMDALITPYAGYLHLGPRLLAELVALFPVSSAAGLLAIVAAFTTAALAALVYVASADHLTGTLPRLLVAAVTVLVPLGQDELPNAIANLHWPALYAMFWLLLWRPVGANGRVVAAAAVLVIALSDVLTVVFLPLALWRWWRWRGRADVALLLCYGAGLAGQAVSMLVSDGGARELPIDPVNWAPWWVLRVVPPALVGERWLGVDVNGGYLALSALAWLALAALVICAVRAHGGVPRLHRAAPVAGLALAHSVALFALPAILSGMAPARYAAAPAMLLITFAVAVAFPQDRRNSPGLVVKTPGLATSPGDLSRWRVGGQGVLVAVLAVVWAVNLSVANSRGIGPAWSAGVERGRAVCEEPTAAATVRIPVSPASGDWTVVVPCERLAGRWAR